MPEVIIRGKRVRYDDTQAIGKGGEADVYDLGGEVLKVFKPADHPDLALEPAAQTAAVRRIAEHQKKLPALMALALPATVVVPKALATNRKGEIVGYVMPYLAGAEVLLRLSQQDYRRTYPTDQALAVLRTLHAAVTSVHAAGVVVGDFNDLNVLVAGTEVHLIDADSMQLGEFICKTFTATFVDPMNCDPGANEPMLVKPHTMNSDWYAFAVMVMQTLLYVGPYGGVAKGVLRNQRPLKRVTVFDPTVRYPKPAIPFKVLSDDLLHHLQAVFQKDLRGVFPVALLERLRWTKCAACGAEHARDACPSCSTVAPAAVKSTTMVRGKVTATRVFTTKGRILRAEAVGGKILWLSHEGSRLRREDGQYVATTLRVDAWMRIRLRLDETIFGTGRVVERVSATGLDRVDVDTGPRPMFDANANHLFWVQGGTLYRDKEVGFGHIGDVLRGQTMFWVGSEFGFGFYRAGRINVAFTFTSTARSLNDTVKLSINGKLVDAACAFARDRVWFFTTTQEGSKLVNRCSVVCLNGDVEAMAEADHGDGSWLGKIGGAAATGGVLLVPTDDGVVQVKCDGGHLVEAKRYPDTEPFVDSDSKLLAGADGLYVVTHQDITRLVIK